MRWWLWLGEHRQHSQRRDLSPLLPAAAACLEVGPGVTLLLDVVEEGEVCLSLPLWTWWPPAAGRVAQGHGVVGVLVRRYLPKLLLALAVEAHAGLPCMGGGKG